MVENFTPAWIAGSLGVLLILVKYWKIIYNIFRIFLGWLLGPSRFRKVLKWFPNRYPAEKSPLPFLKRLVEYGLAMTVAFIGFYSAYLLSLKKTLEDQMDKSKQLLLAAEMRCHVIEAVLEKYTSTNALGVNSLTLSDSDVVINYCYNSVRQPFYITDAVAPNQILSYLTVTGYVVLSGLEQNEQVAHSHVLDTRLSYFDRHMSYIAFMRFETLRDSLIHSEREYLLGSLTPMKLTDIERKIGWKNNALAVAVNPRLYSQLKLDSLFADEPEDSGKIDFVTSEENLDSLWRYSYLLFGVRKGLAIGIGNGFFMKKKGQLFLATSYELMTSWECWDPTIAGARISPYPDTLMLRMYHRDDHRSEFVPINISKIKANSRRILGEAQPDIYFYELTDTAIVKKFEVFSVDSPFLIIKNHEEGLNDLFIVGCTRSEIKTLYNCAESKAWVFISNVAGLYGQYLYYTDFPGPDSINYRINLAPDHSLFGSPVFFEEYMPEVDHFKKVLRFGGMFTGNDSSHINGVAIRPDQVLRAFEKTK